MSRAKVEAKAMVIYREFQDKFNATFEEECGVACLYRRGFTLEEAIEMLRSSPVAKRGSSDPS